ncbi:MAG: ABC transporter permease [Acidimicrobiales bacterium]
MTAPVDPMAGDGLVGPTGGPAPTPLTRQLFNLSPGQRILLIGLGGVLMLSIVRIIADTPELTSSGTSGAALRLAVPIGLAALGGIFAERSGIINIGLEGMMILGTWFGAWGAWQFGAWEGVAIGLLGGALGGLIHAIATVTFGVDQIISGVAINILGAGLARYLSVITYTTGTGGGATQSPTITNRISTVDVPVLAGGDIGGWTSPDVLGWFNRQEWFFVSDLAGILRGFVANVSLFTLLAVALFPAVWWLLWRTRFGLRLRSVGENPTAAESLGIPVYRMKYAAVTLSGAMAGLGGAFLSIAATNIYREGQTGGRGFIGLAAMIFGNWNPFGAAAGAGLFGFTDALQLRSDAAVHALLLFVALLTAVLTVRAVIQKRMLGAILLAATSAAFLIWYITSDAVPRQFVSVTPYVVTLLVLGFATQRLRPPGAIGKPYRRGETH